MNPFYAALLFISRQLLRDLNDAYLYCCYHYKSRCWGGTICGTPAPCFQVRLSILLHLRCSSFILLCRSERANLHPQVRPAGPSPHPEEELNNFSTQHTWPELQHPRPLPPTPHPSVYLWQPPTPPKSPIIHPSTPNETPSTPNKIPSTPNKTPSTPNRFPSTPDKSPSLLRPVPETPNSKNSNSPPSMSPTPDIGPPQPVQQVAASPSWIMEREFLGHVDQRIQSVARAYVRELLKESMDDLD